MRNARFLVVGPSDPGFLSRLIEPIAKLGEVPTRVHASRESGDGSELSVDLRLSGVSRRTAELVENALTADRRRAPGDRGGRVSCALAKAAAVSYHAVDRT